MKRLIFLLLVLWSVLGLGQTHIFPALDTNNVFTGTNTFLGPTVIGGNLTPLTAGGATVGTAPLPYSSFFVGNAATNNIQITGTATAARVFTLPDANSNPVQPLTCAANNFETAISGTGLISCATAVVASSAPANQFATSISAAGALGYTQPTFPNLSGSIALSQITNLGTTTTLLHGNAAGNAAFSAVVTADLNITPTTCTNQFLNAISAGAGGTCTTATLASAQFANQGTTTTLLHGNAAGNPSFSAVSLTADVTGTLPLGNVGSPTGTGYAHITAGAWDAASKLINLTAATDVAANQGTTTTLLHGNAAGQAVFGSVVSADLNITTTTCTNQFLTAISATGVGTCTTDTLASAQHANQGTTTTVLHGNGAGNPSFAVVTPSDAAGNTNGSGNFALTTSPVFVTPTLGVATATAVVSATASSAAAGVIRLANADTINFRNNAGSGDVTIAKTLATSGLVLADTLNISSFAGLFMAGPIWGANSIAVDTTHPISIPAATDTMAVLALAQTFTNKRLTPRIVTMADAASVTPTSDTADENIFTSTQVAGTLTVNAPTGTPTDGQKLILRLKSTNAQTYSFNATYAFSTTTTAPTTLAAGKSDNIGLIWNATNTKWDVVAVDQGH